MSFRKRLKEEITYNGLLLKEVADKAGIPKRTLDTYVDKREIIPPADVAVRLANVLDVTVEYLVTGETSATTNNKRPNYWYLNMAKKSDDEIIDINKMYKKVQEQQYQIEQLKKELNPDESIDTYLESEDISVLQKVSKMQEQQILELQKEIDDFGSYPRSFCDNRIDFLQKKIDTLREIHGYDFFDQEPKTIEDEKKTLFANFINKIKSLKDDELNVIEKILDSFSKNKEI